MTRDEQLVYCKQCTNRKMDLQQGMLCGITGEKAAFDGTCPDFQVDEVAKEAMLNDKIGLPTETLNERLSTTVLEELREEQHFQPAVAAGIIVGLIGAALWGLITVATGFQIGFMAIGIGAGVGLTIRFIGKGVDVKFGYAGAVIALFSVILGNILSIIGFAANMEGMSYFETMYLIDYSYMPEIMMETFAVVDLLFYGFAIYEGYRFSFRVVTEKKLEELMQKK